MCSEAPRKQPLSVAVLGVLLFTLVLGACGKKGDPLPPLRTVPLQTKDLTVSQQGSAIFLEMAPKLFFASVVEVPGLLRLCMTNWSSSRY